jgi:hypothetical protein
MRSSSLLRQALRPQRAQVSSIFRVDMDTSILASKICDGYFWEAIIFFCCWCWIAMLRVVPPVASRSESRSRGAHGGLYVFVVFIILVVFPFC